MADARARVFSGKRRGQGEVKISNVALIFVAVIFLLCLWQEFRNRG